MDRANHPVLSVVIPVYCEGAHVESVLNVIVEALDALDRSYEVIVVDDGSTDATWMTLERAVDGMPALTAIRLSRNFGKEAAISAGLEAARGDAVVVMDGDLQHPPELIAEMVRVWEDSDADVVEGVKQGRGEASIADRLRAKLFYRALTWMSGYELGGASDYKLMDRKVVSEWLAMRERSLFFRGMVAWLGFRRVQLPFDVPVRAGGRTKWTAFRLARLATVAITSFSALPLQFVSITGVVFMVFSVILGVQTLLMKFSGEAVDGFTTVILLLLIVGSLLMLSLGIIGRYIAGIFEEVKRRPRYVIADVIGRSDVRPPRPFTKRDEWRSS